MNEFDSNLTKSLEDFMESYKMVDVEQIYSNGTEFVPIFRVKQWLEYNNINNLQSKIDKAIEFIDGRIQALTVSVDNKAKDEYFNNKCIGGIQELKNVKEFLKEDK